MSVAALTAWLITAGGGLYLLTIWLIEFDHEFQSAAATRLPVPVISAHAVLAVAGLAVWAAYLITDRGELAWSAALMLALVAGLGVTLAIRWLVVYRATRSRDGRAAGRYAGAAPAPPERHFPVPVVIAHGLAALTTIVLVVLAALRGGA
jgi:hypothetical protein